MKPVVAKNYDLTRGEQVTSSYFTPLEVVLKNYLCQLESFFFDQFNISCRFDFHIEPAGKFSDYLESIAQPTPIFVFELSALQGDSLLILDNSLANLFLERESLVRDGRAKVPREFKVDLQNYPLLEDVVDQALHLFAGSWSRLLPCGHKVDKLVSHRIKAKIMNPDEACLKARIQVHYRGFTSAMEFCFSAYQLDPILKNYSRQALLTGEAGHPQPDLTSLRRLIEKEAKYEAKAVIGGLYLSREDLVESMDTGAVLPLSSELKQGLALYLNGRPLLSGEPGTSLGHQAIKLQGRIEEVQERLKKIPKPFTKQHFPKA
ncbi:MAG: FliM/FliN family flagellar motor switch protein [bacterium]|nr:FliM/FliN family flagellar motor switch protein [bacterium]